MRIKFTFSLLTFLCLTTAALAQKPLICRYPLAGKKTVAEQSDSRAVPEKPVGIRLACHSTLQPAEPLYVLDGTIISTQEFSRVDPNTIQSITKLKEASAVALYGIRGRSGVIIITTKPICFIKDKKDGSPVAGATVEIRTKDGARFYISDSAGQMLVTGISTSEIREIHISSVGYKPAVFTFSPGQEPVLSFELEPTEEVMDTVIVEGYERRRIGCGFCSIRCTKIHCTRISPEVKPNLTVFPNPAPRNSVLTISLPEATNANYLVRIYHADGKTAVQQNISGTAKRKFLQLNLPASLTAGVYFISISAAGKLGLTTQRVVVQ